MSFLGYRPVDPDGAYLHDALQRDIVRRHDNKVPVDYSRYTSTEGNDMVDGSPDLNTIFGDDWYFPVSEGFDIFPFQTSDSKAPMYVKPFWNRKDLSSRFDKGGPLVVTVPTKHPLVAAKAIADEILPRVFPENKIDLVHVFPESIWPLGSNTHVEDMHPMLQELVGAYWDKIWFYPTLKKYLLNTNTITVLCYDLPDNLIMRSFMARFEYSFLELVYHGGFKPNICIVGPQMGDYRKIDGEFSINEELRMYRMCHQIDLMH